jgi:sugar phosphate isomerase/epimerase
MANFSLDCGYYATEAGMRGEIEAAIPFGERHGVRIGVQPHCGTGITGSMELMHLIRDFDPARVGAIWDAGHSGLAGEDPVQGLQIVASHLCMVNLKNAFYARIGKPGDGTAEWEPFWTEGPSGLSSWPAAAGHLIRTGYAGTICLCAEYTDEARVDESIARDLRYARALFGAVRP